MSALFTDHNRKCRSCGNRAGVWPLDEPSEGRRVSVEPRGPTTEELRACVLGDANAVTSRDLDSACASAVGALERYAEALRFWNAPDDEHTRIQLRNLTKAVIDGVLPSCSRR